jgi:flagellar FliJ protein
MSKFHAIELAIALATRQRDALALKHAQSIRNLNFGKDQLAQLTGYAADTDVRWTTGGTAVALSAELIRHHYQFMDRLQNAVQMQTGVLANLEVQVLAAHKALLQAEYKLAGLEKVLSARKTQHIGVLARREQRMTDEFAAQRHARTGAPRLGETL